jgi:hypothetical protein
MLLLLVCTIQKTVVQIDNQQHKVWVPTLQVFMKERVFVQ